MDSKDRGTEKSESEHVRLIKLQHSLKYTDDPDKKAGIKAEMSAIAENLRREFKPEISLKNRIPHPLVHITDPQDIDLTQLGPSILPKEFPPADKYAGIGTVKANANKTYNWMKPREGNEYFAFWPLSRSGDFPDCTTTGQEYDWNGEAGSRFWYYFERESCLGMCAVANIFEFTLPKVDRRSYIRWGAHCIFNAPTQWYTNCEEPMVRIEWAYHESPFGVGFPVDYRIGFTTDNFLFINEDNLWQLTALKQSIRYYEGVMLVEPGIAAKVYVGLSMNLASGDDGTISTVHLGGAGDMFRIGALNWDGIKYEITPVEE